MQTHTSVVLAHSLPNFSNLFLCGIQGWATSKTEVLEKSVYRPVVFVAPVGSNAR